MPCFDPILCILFWKYLTFEIIFLNSYAAVSAIFAAVSAILNQNKFNFIDAYNCVCSTASAYIIIYSKTVLHLQLSLL